MNADVEKAVEWLDRWSSTDFDGDCERADDWRIVRQALRDKDAEIARLRKIEEERWSVVATRNAAVMRAEKAEALLRECNAVALKRGDKYGLCDAIDNDGQPYQSAHLAAHLGAAK